MAEFSQAASGLVGEIRSAITSEQYDLANYTQSRAHDLITNAFSTPLDAPSEMIRFTFVVGGGKLVRSKYDDDLPKWLGAALREIGFEEDRSAALDFTSQGTFKQQHDTGQNLKYLIVFPHVTCADSKAGGDGSVGAAQGHATNSPEYIIAACELSTFTDVVVTKAPSWSQKKKMLKVLQDASENFKSIEAKLMRGEALSAVEQAVCDSNSGQDDQKVVWLQSEIKGMVDKGQITARERSEVLAHIETTIATLTAELEKTRAEGKSKKVAVLEERLATLTERKKTVSSVTPLTHHRLRLGDEIQKLRMKLFAFAPLEEKQRQGGLTLAELKALEPKIDIEENIAALEQASKGWFDDEEDFQLSCEYEAKEAKAKYAAKNKAAAAKKKSGATANGAKPAAKKSSGGAMPWETIGVKKKVVAQPAKAASSGGYAAAFGNDDSDSDN